MGLQERVVDFKLEGADEIPFLDPEKLLADIQEALLPSPKKLFQELEEREITDPDQQLEYMAKCGSEEGCKQVIQSHQDRIPVIKRYTYLRDASKNAADRAAMGARFFTGLGNHQLGAEYHHQAERHRVRARIYDEKIKFQENIAW